MPTKQLRELEEAGLVLRAIHAEAPPRVEYALTASGQGLRPVLLALEQWGQGWMAARGQVPVDQPSSGRAAAT
nr:helix-turn-helix domain-containing protein [Siccirubricoccus soli]